MKDPFVTKSINGQWMIAFESNSTIEIAILNSITKEILDELDLHPIHQIGRLNEPGYHAWEVWGYTNQETLEHTALPIILDRVNRLKEIW